MFCPNCGTGLMPGGVFCVQCGQRVPAQPDRSATTATATPPRPAAVEPPRGPTSSPNASILPFGITRLHVIGGGIVVVVLGIVVLWYFEKHPILGDEYTNSIGMKFKRIKAGTFIMGDPDQILYGPSLMGQGQVMPDQAWHPRHKVTLTKDFYMAECETTLEQYRRFKGEHSNGYYEGTDPNLLVDEIAVAQLRRTKYPNYAIIPPDELAQAKRDVTATETFQRASLDSRSYPVVKVSWEDAAAFCKWLSDKEKKNYRLPTEAEWEYCCRAGRSNEDSKYPWGMDWPPPARVGNFADSCLERVFQKADKVDPGYRERYTDGFETLAPVGSFAANPWGLHDMCGNVAEWCEDWYDFDFCRHDATDPCQREQNGLTQKVVRDQSWLDSWDGKLAMQSARRDNVDPGTRSPRIGFRVVLAPND